MLGLTIPAGAPAWTAAESNSDVKGSMSKPMSTDPGWKKVHNSGSHAGSVQSNRCVAKKFIWNM